MPIKVYSIVHTIGNRIQGGERAGLFSVSKASILSFVIRPESEPTARGMAIHNVSNL